MDTHSDEPSLGMSAEDFYKEQQRDRTGPVELARRISDITLPSLFAPEEWKQGDDLDITNQSIGAYLVNTLASNLTTAALPPNLPMAKFEAEEEELSDDIKEDPSLWAQVTYSLSRLEQSHRKRLSRTKARATYGRAMRLLLVAGNACILWTEINKPRCYDMHHYVVKRSADGEQIVIVLKDSVSYATADPDIREAAQEAWIGTDSAPKTAAEEWTKSITIYHVQTLVGEGDDAEWHYWQEVEGGTVVEGSEAWSPYDVPHMWAGGLIHKPGSDWCLPYCVDYEGDLRSVETLESSLQDGAAGMSWFLTFVNSESGITNIHDVRKADNLDILTGRADDVSTHRADKGGDLNFVVAQAERVARRLGIAFAVRAAIQRDGERVTAEEWQTLTQELDRAMGGLYTQVSDGIHRWFVLRGVHLHEIEKPSLRPKPEGLIKVSVNTGMDAIGQSSDHGNLMGWVNDSHVVAGPEVFAKKIQVGDIYQRLASYRGVKMDGLMKTPEQEAAENQQQQQMQQQQTLLEQGAGPVAKEGAGMIAKMMQAQQQGNTQDE